MEDGSDLSLHDWWTNSDEFELAGVVSPEDSIAVESRRSQYVTHVGGSMCGGVDGDPMPPHVQNACTNDMFSFEAVMEGKELLSYNVVSVTNAAFWTHEVRTRSSLR